jgi:hypothetical protein
MDTKVTIQRGSVVEDDFGDELDVPRAVAVGVPAFVRVPAGVRGVSGSDPTKGVVRIPDRYGCDLRIGDRIMDESSGETFRVDELRRTTGMPGYGYRLGVTRVSGAR